MKKKLVKAVTVTMTGVVAATSTPVAPATVLAQEVEDSSEISDDVDDTGTGGSSEDTTGSGTEGSGGSEGEGTTGEGSGSEGEGSGSEGEVTPTPTPTPPEEEVTLDDIGVLGSLYGEITEVDGKFYSTGSQISVAAAGLTEDVDVTGIEVYAVLDDTEKSLIKKDDSSEINKEDLPSYEGTLMLRITLADGKTLEAELQDYIPQLKDMSTYVEDKSAPELSSSEFSGDMDPVVIEGTTYYQEDGTVKLTFSDAEGIGIDEDSLKVTGVGSEYYQLSGDVLSIDTTGLVDGKNTITVEIADKLGNSMSEELQVFMFRGTPSVVCSGVSGNVYIKGDTTYAKTGEVIEVTLVGCNDARYKSFELLSDEGTIESFNAESTGDEKKVVIPVGSTNVRLKVTDVTGNTSEVSLESLTSGKLTDSIAVDDDVPVIANPVINSGLVEDSGNQVSVDADGTITFDVEDTGAGVKEVKVTREGISVPFEFDGKTMSIALKDLSQGENDLHIAVSDNLGNTAESDIVQWVLTQTPTITGRNISSMVVSDSKSYTNKDVTVSLGGYSAWGIKSIELLGGVDTVAFVDGKATITEDGTYTVRVTDIADREQTYNLTDLFSDLTTNVVEFDTDGPSIGMGSFSGTTREGVDGVLYLTSDGEFTINISDSGCGTVMDSTSVMNSISFERNGDSITIDSSQFTDGQEVTITVQAVDALGNTSTVQVADFKVMREGTVPVGVSHDSVVAKDGIAYTNKSVSVTINLDRSKVSKVELLKDGSVLGEIDDTFSIEESGKYTIRVTNLFDEATEYSLEQVFADSSIPSEVVFDEDAPVAEDPVFSGSSRESDGVVYYTSNGTITYKIADSGVGVDVDSINVLGLSSDSYKIESDGTVVISTSGLSEGQTNYSIRYADLLGNSDTIEGEVNMYRTTPTVSIESVSGEYITVGDKTYFNNKLNVYLTVTASNRISYLYLVNEEGERTEIEGNYFAIEETGNYTVEIVDILGDVTEYNLEEIGAGIYSDMELDTDTPTISSKSFSGDKETVGDRVYYTSDGIISMDISDFGCGVDSESWVVRGIDSQYVTISEDGLNIQIDTTGLVEGISQISVSVSDMLGNRMTDTSDVYMYRSTPVIEGFTHGSVVVRDGVSYTVSDVNVNISGFDSEKITKIELLKDGSVVGEVEEGTFTIEESGNYTLQVTDLLGDTKTYRMQDLFSDGFSSEVEFDVESPEIAQRSFNGTTRVVDDKLYYTSDGILTLGVADTGVGLAEDFYQVSGVSADAVSVEGSNVLIDTSYLSEGESTLRVQVKDALGNIREYSIELYMFRTVPTVSGDTVSGNYYTATNTFITGSLNFSINVTETPKVASVELTKDGESVMGITNNRFSISESGNYAVVLTDILGDKHSYNLSDLFKGISSNVVLDEDAPATESENFSGDAVAVDGQVYYTSNGTYTVVVRDTGSGINRESWNISGIDSQYVSVSKDGTSVGLDTTGLTDGNHTIELSVKDNLGNTYNYKVKMFMHREFPSITGGSHSNVFVREGNIYIKSTMSVQLRGYDSYKVKDIELLKNGEAIDDITSTGSFEIDDSGEYTIRVTDLINTVNVYSLSDLFSDLPDSVIVDVDTPEVSSVEFTGQRAVVDDVEYYITDGDIVVSLSDAASGVNNDSVKITGVSSEDVSVANGVVTINTENIPEGNNTLHLTVEDYLGNLLEYDIPVFMFRYAPEITGVSHSSVSVEEGYSYINRNLEVSLGGWDNYKIKTIELYRNGTLVDNVEEGSFAVSSSGEYTIRVVDLVNNARVYRLEDLFEDITSKVVIDTVVPEAQITVDGKEVDSSAWITGDGKLKVALSDETGLSSATVSVNGQEFSRVYDNSTEEVIEIDLRSDVTRAENGIYRVVVSVKDIAGNTLNADTQTVRADFDAPSFTDLSAEGFFVEDRDTGKVYLRGDLHLTGSTSDIGSGVDKVELLRDGTVVATGLPLNILASGTYSVRVTDKAGLSSEVLLSSALGTSSNDLIVDNAAPVVERSSGFNGDLTLDGDIWYGSAPQLVYHISDDNMRSIRITVNGNTVIDRVSEDGVYSIDTSGYEGDVTVRVEATDRIGNTSSDVFSYRADFASPSDIRAMISEEYTSKSGSIFFKSTPSVVVSARDTGIGISEYRLTGSKFETNENGRFTLGTGSYMVEVVDRLGHTTGVLSLGELLGMRTNRFVVDGENPTIRATKPESSYNNWYGEDVDYTINLADNVGLDSAEVYINNQRVETYSTSATDETSAILHVSTSEVPESSNGMYQIRVIVADNAGNLTEWSDTVYVDRTAPTVDRFVFTGDGYSEGVETNGGNRYGFFFNGGASCEIHVSDGEISSGLSQLMVTLESTDGSVSTQTVNISNGVGRVTIPDNFKGFVSAYAVDRVGHQGAVNQPDGVVTESSNYHINSVSVDIQMPETSFQDASGNPLYSADMSASATVGCSISGIRSMEWGIGSETLGSVSVNSNGSLSGDSASVTATDRNLVLSLNKALSLQGNANGLTIWVRVTDRTGHTSESNRVFSIDKDAPQISVSYDTSEEDTYYAVNRTATITVQERNFDPNQFRVTGQAGSLGSWSNNGDVWTNTMTFAEDGTYQFNLSCTDRAGNESAGYGSESFTIDKTAPQLTVSWNNDNPSNGDYYNSTRVATVTVIDRNFDPTRFALTGDGVLSGWSNNGNVHTATVEFSQDGQYHFSISGEDLAGNRSETYDSGVFNIDATVPVLEITGVENSVSYKEDVGFTIRMSDNNIDMTRTSVSLVGRKNGAIRINGTLNEQTGEYSFTSFPREEMYDDIYTLTATVVDKAGNTSEQVITFSINRFGSKYSFTDPSILGTYLREAKDVVITETNVDQLDTNAARVAVIKDGADYPVDSKYIHITEEVGADGKYTYTYRIDKEAFSEDGAYLVQIYSHAVEGTDYNSLSQEYAFVLDTTAPEIIVSGVESGKTYRDYERTVTIDVRDLSGVQEITVELNGENVPLNRANGVYSFTIQESSDPQNLVVHVVDMAGNESTVSVENFILSSESTVYLVNQSWFRWGIVAVAAFLAAIIALIIKNRRAAKKDEEEVSKRYSELYKTSSGSSSASGSSSTGGKDLVGDLDSTEDATTDVMDDEVHDLDSDSTDDSNK